MFSESHSLHSFNITSKGNEISKTNVKAKLKLVDHGLIEK